VGGTELEAVSVWGGAERCAAAHPTSASLHGRAGRTSGTGVVPRGRPGRAGLKALQLLLGLAVRLSPGTEVAAVSRMRAVEHALRHGRLRA